MELVTIGKTKDIYKLDDTSLRMIFKDDMTGTEGSFDPGANAVGLTVLGAGKAGLALSAHFFKIIGDKGYPTHYLSANLEENSMDVVPARVFGKGLEIICRYRGVGSFIRRYGEYLHEGDNLDALVEMTLKDDERGDPFITQDTLEAIGVLKSGEYASLVDLTKNISGVIKDELAEKGLELYDIKLEFGKDKDGNNMLIDEVSGGNMRVYGKDSYIMPLELAKIVLEK